MFNVNDNKDDLFSNETKDTKETPKQTLEFTGFSHKQEEVILVDKNPTTSVPENQISFQDFEEAPVPDDSVNKKDKKSLKEYFRQNRATQKQLKIEKATQKKPKRIRRKKRKEIEDFDDIKKRRAYKFKRKKYTKVDSFIKYLNENYLDLDEIAETILNDENFHGWLKKKSKRFDESIDAYKDIIETIGN